MRLVEINWRPNHSQVLQFAWICAAAMPLVGWLWGAGVLMVGMLGAAGAALALAGWFAPRLVSPVFVALSVLALPIGLVVSELVLLLMYFAIILPIGQCLRLARRDALQREWAPHAKTYWQPKPPPRGASSYLRQS